MKVVVTGALGHIGSSLIRDPELVSAAREIILIDNLSTQRFPSLFDLPPWPKYTLLPFDVELAFTKDLAENCDAVIHLAASTDPDASMRNPRATYENNLRITHHVVQTCLTSHTPLVFVSTTSVYTANSCAVDEDSTTQDPTSPYAKCKLDEESLVLAAAARGLPIAIFRFGTIFGVSQGMRFHTAVNKFCWQAATGQVIDVWRTALEQQRPYLDVVDASTILSRTVGAKIFPGEIVNAVTCDTTVADVLRVIRKCGVETQIRLVDSPLMNDLSYTTNTSRAKGLGFTFKGSLDTQIAATLSRLARLSPN